MPELLFIGHEASRTGAPIVLLHLLKWLRENVGWRTSVLLARGGPLLPSFRNIAPTYVLADSIWDAPTRTRRLLKRSGLDRLGVFMQGCSAGRSLVGRADLIYCNTLDVLPALQLTSNRGRRTLCHVHELESTIQVTIGSLNARRILAQSDRVIACATAVANNLVRNHAVPANRLDTVYEFVPTSRADELPPIEESRRRLRRHLGIADNALVVGASGQLGWRKGSDLFVQLAGRLRSRARSAPVHCLWLGGSAASSAGIEFEHDRQRAGLTEHITLIPSQPDPLSYFAGLDLFVLPSREDPFPLVCLEAASCGIPIVCFGDAGGMPEFVEDDCGVVVPYLDMDAMADSVSELLMNPARRQVMGRAAQSKVRARHDIAVAGPKVLNVIERTLRGVD